MLKQKLISLMTVAFASLITLNSVNAYEDAFTMEGVAVKDANTVEVSFNHDLFADGLDMFELTLTNKETSEDAVISSLELPETNVLSLNLDSELSMDSEYELLVIFVSDDEANAIDNGVDGVVDFIPNEMLVTAKETTTEEIVEEAPVEETVVEEIAPVEEETIEEPTMEPEMPVEEAELNAAAEPMVEEVTTEDDTALEAAAVASETEELPQTGPKEMLFVLIAMLLSLGFLVSRRKA